MAATVFLLLSAFGLASAQTLGTIENFRVLTNGNDFIDLGWDLVAGDVPITKYTLTYDELSTDIPCREPSCSHLVEYLDPCSTYLFDLLPTFEGPVTGQSVSLQANTLDQIPGAPLNPIASSNSNGIIVTWETPTVNANCIDEYQVCAKVVGEINQNCITVTGNTALLEDVQLCSDYTITISALTPVGTSGPSVQTLVTTALGVPGQPQNLEVTLTTEDTITITYDDPLENPNCVEEYGIVYGPVSDVMHEFVPIVKGKYEHVITPLDPCTNYSIGVYGLNANYTPGQMAVEYAATADLEPIGPASISVTPGGTDSIVVTWPPMTGNTCGDTITICWVNDIEPVQECQLLDGGGGLIEGGGSFDITGVLPCTFYEVSVVVNSPSGLESVPVVDFAYTDDVAPGPVVNLAVTSVTQFALTFEYDPPISMPQCVMEYDSRVINLDDVYVNDHQSLRLYQPAPRLSEYVTGLDACTNYRVEVRAVSRQGLQSNWRSDEAVTNEATPSAVRSLQEQLVTVDSVTLLWFEPLFNPRCVTSYLIEWGSHSETLNMPTSEFSVEFTATGLSECTNYMFRVTARSATVGDSPDQSLLIKTACP